MKYENIRSARFINRPNRFIANIELDGRTEVCHVKNTGRCRELLIPGAEIYVQCFDGASRKTNFDLISVRKCGRLINIDSQAPNRAFYEWAAAGNFLPDIKLIRPETKYGDSRFDFYMETAKSRVFAEIKGVTLEDDGVVLFPDAPTERGVKHMRELMDCVRQGCDAYAVFIVQMDRVKYFTPNRATHREFADVLAEAAAKGVQLAAYDCRVTEDSMSIGGAVEIRL